MAKSLVFDILRGAQYETRDGLAVEIIRIQTYPMTAIVGRCKIKTIGWVDHIWGEDGQINPNGYYKSLDLIQTKESKKTINLKDKCKTRNGLKVRLIAINKSGSYPVIGAYKIKKSCVTVINKNRWIKARWSPLGLYIMGVKSHLDLIKVTK